MNDVNLKAWVDKYKSSHQFKIDEKISALKIRITFSSSDRGNYLFADLFNELSKIPSRDSFSLEITKGVDDGKVFLQAAASYQAELLECLQSTINLDAPFEVLLVVDKECANGFLSVYFIEKIDEYFLERDALNLIRELSLKFKEGIHFVVFSPIKQFGSKTIFFAPANAAPIYVDHRKRLKIISKFKDSSSFLGYEDYAAKLLPADFYTEDETAFLNIKNFFDKAFFLLSFAFISNQSEIKKENDNQYYFLTKIHGYKALAFDACSYYGGRISAQILYKIYDWIYQSDAGNSVEKIGLVRNLISLHASDSEEIVVDDVLWQAVKSNYKVYLQENVEVYLEAKSKIAEVLTASVEKTQEIVEGVVGSIRAAIGVLVTFLLTVVLINAFKDLEKAEKIFSTSYLIIVFIISICTWLWIYYSIKDAKSRFEYASENIENIILSSYKNILLPSEITESTSEVKNKNIKYLDEYMGKYKRYFKCFILLFLGLYSIGFLIFSELSFFKGLGSSIFAFLFGSTAV